MFNYATKTQKINLLTKKSHKWNWEISANALKFKRIKIHLNFKGTKNRNFIALKQNANLDLKLKLRRNLPQITKTNSQLRLFWLQRQISFDFILKFYAPECALIYLAHIFAALKCKRWAWTNQNPSISLHINTAHGDLRYFEA